MLGRLEATLHDGLAEVAFLYAPPSWGRGLATDGLRWLHRELRSRSATALWATTDPENTASAALLTRCGYRRVASDRRPLLCSFDDGDTVFAATNEG